MQAIANHRWQSILKYKYLISFSKPLSRRVLEINTIFDHVVLYMVVPYPSVRLPWFAVIIIIFITPSYSWLMANGHYHAYHLTRKKK